jgi:hypothetical protein
VARLEVRPVDHRAVRPEDHQVVLQVDLLVDHQAVFQVGSLIEHRLDTGPRTEHPLRQYRALFQFRHEQWHEPAAPAGPPDPVPKWARPPGTVPVIAIAAPAPRWVHPNALASTHNAAAMRTVPYQAGPGQAMPMQAAPGMVGYQNGIQNGIQQQQYQVAQATNPNPPAVPADPGVFNGQGGAAGVNAPQQIVPLQPGQQQFQAAPQAGMQPGYAPQMAAPQMAPQYAAPQYGVQQYGPAQQMPAYAGPALPIQQVPQGFTPYVQAPPRPVPAGPINPPSSVSTVYGYSDTGARPPGTLGKTYMRPTRMIDWDKHPRIGMLDVEVIDTLRAGLASDVKIKVTSRDMYNYFKPLEGFRGDDGIWHFESDPLLTTVPNIYDVKFELIRERTVFEKRYGRVFEKTVEENLGSLGTQRVRLIPGRIVDLVYY